jgi:hypothetical protein
MTPSEVAELLERVEKRWPHAPLPLGSGDVWLEDLADVDAGAAHEAVRAFSRSGEKFPPTSGWVRSEAQRRAQDGPPGFDDIDPSKWLPTRVLLHGGIYSPDGHYSAETAAKAIAVMSVNGCHEAVLRFVAERGLARGADDAAWRPLRARPESDGRSSRPGPPLPGRVRAGLDARSAPGAGAGAGVPRDRR